jgi:hypothetical protein
MPPAIWRVLVQCHQLRNVAEYEGYLEVSDQLLAELIDATETLRRQLVLLAPIKI